MTEGEWLTCSDPETLLRGMQAEVSGRKCRLFAVACGRSVLSEFRAERTDAERALELAERFADELASLGDLRQEWERKRSQREPGWYVVKPACSPYPSPSTDFHTALCASKNAIGFAPTAWVRRNPGQRQKSKGAIRATELTRKHVVSLLQDIIGNPFRPVTFADSWRTETAVALASGIYAERAFDRLPILADALEEAGCDNAEVLSHCRGPGPHARGCWVVDGVLGKV